MNVNRVPFKQMKATIGALQVAALMVVATLDTKTLNAEQKVTALKVILARDNTAQQMKRKPPRHKLLALCGVWYRLAAQVQPLIPAEQPAVRESFAKALDEAGWVKTLEAEMRVTEDKL